MNRQFFAALFVASLMLDRAWAQNNSVEVQRATMERQRSQVQSAMGLSIQKQIASIRHQRTAAAEEAFLVLPALIERSAPTPDCDPLSPLTVQQMAGKAATVNQISTDLVMAVIHQESGFRPCAVSEKGAMGLMQLMPDTAANLGIGDAFDAEQNIGGGAKLLKTLLDRYGGDLNRALGAYNAGPSRVDFYGGIPPFAETENYVESITRALATSRRAH